MLDILPFFSLQLTANVAHSASVPAALTTPAVPVHVSDAMVAKIVGVTRTSADVIK